MKIWKHAVLFYLGGAGYMTLEFAWRGRSHGSMFLLGGLCFTVLGRLGKLHLSLPAKAILGTATVTALELAAGLLINRDYRVWDYRRLPMNWMGQICLPYSLMWLPLCLAAMGIYEKAEAVITRPSRRSAQDFRR